MRGFCDPNFDVVTQRRLSRSEKHRIRSRLGAVVIPLEDSVRRGMRRFCDVELWIRRYEIVRWSLGAAHRDWNGLVLVSIGSPRYTYRTKTSHLQ